MCIRDRSIRFLTFVIDIDIHLSPFYTKSIAYILYQVKYNIANFLYQSLYIMSIDEMYQG